MPDYTDPLAAAMKRTFASPSTGSFFPAANKMLAQTDRQDLGNMLNQSPETQFLGPSPTPTPTTTPGPVKPTRMTLSDLMTHFGVENPVTSAPATSSRPLYQNKPDQQIYDWHSKYGWAGA